jgi:cob(I)alamin adenosyltransferase
MTTRDVPEKNLQPGPVPEVEGRVHVYTGDGKGKTTAALGLAMRAAGAGFKVFVAQFVKGMDYSELHSFALLHEWITIRQYGRRCFIRDTPGEEDMLLARRGFEESARAVASGDFRVVILDEASIAIHYHLFSVDELLGLIASRPPHVEIVVTGRHAPPELIACADLVTEMREVKHYFREGLLARTGIEC